MNGPLRGKPQPCPRALPGNHEGQARLRRGTGEGWRRLKKKWRKEWEDERRKAEAGGSDAVFQAITRKLERAAERHHAAMSPRTRAAHAEYLRLEALDEAEGYDPYADPEHEFYLERNGGAGGEARDEEADEMLALPEPESVAEAEPGPKVRTLKDESWG